MTRPRPAIRWIVLLGVAGLLAAGIASPEASAHQQRGATVAVASSISETVVIPEDNYTVYAFSLWVGETITYDIRVTDGSAIDVYFMPPDGLVDYADPSATQFRIFERLQDRTSFNGTFGVASGDIDVVIDNADIGGATPLGTVVVAVSMHKNPSIVYLGAVGLIAAGVALLAGAAILARRGGRKPAEAHRPPPKPYEKRPSEGSSAEPEASAPPPPEGPKEGP